MVKHITYRLSCRACRALEGVRYRAWDSICRSGGDPDRLPRIDTGAVAGTLMTVAVVAAFLAILALVTSSHLVTPLVLAALILGLVGAVVAEL